MTERRTYNLEPRCWSLRSLPAPQHFSTRLFADVQGDQCLDAHASKPKQRRTSTARLPRGPSLSPSRAYCPVHNPRGAARIATEPPSVVAPVPEQETEEAMRAKLS